MNVRRRAAMGKWVNNIANWEQQMRVPSGAWVQKKAFIFLTWKAGKSRRVALRPGTQWLTNSQIALYELISAKNIRVYVQNLAVSNTNWSVA